MNVTLTGVEQGSVLFFTFICCMTSIILCVYAVFYEIGGSCCLCLAGRVVYRKCCRCKRFTAALEKHLKEDDDDDE